MPSFLGCALLSGLAVGACSTEQVSADPSNVIFVAVASPEYNSAAGIFVIRDDAYDASLMPRNLPAYGVTVDGRLAAWDETAFVQAGPASAVGFTLPAGSRVIIRSSMTRGGWRSRASPWTHGPASIRRRAPSSIPPWSSSAARRLFAPAC